MNKGTNYVGIDVSKDSLDVYCEPFGHQQFINDSSGFNKLIKQNFAVAKSGLPYDSDYKSVAQVF